MDGSSGPLPLPFVRTDAHGVRRSGTGPVRINPDIIVIGASTGGPQALVVLLSGLTPALPTVPVCVTLHMPRDLMPVVASYVARQCRVETKVVDGLCQLRPGLVHFAPGDKHFDFHRRATGVDALMAPGAARNYCKPAVDVMFSAAARVFGPRTGRGCALRHGARRTRGAREIAAAGGALFVQDKESSAVWGMPGAVAKAGLPAVVLPPDGIAREIVRRLRGGPGASA